MRSPMPSTPHAQEASLGFSMEGTAISGCRQELRRSSCEVSFEGHRALRPRTAPDGRGLSLPSNAWMADVRSLKRQDSRALYRPSQEIVDGATNAILEQLRQRIPKHLEPEVINTDLGPPYIHVQTIGAVCGEDEHIEAQDLHAEEWKEDLQDRLEETRDPKMWGTEAEMRRTLG